MNLVEKLIKIDKGEITKKETKKLHSRKLANILGENEPVEITIKEISGDEFVQISAMGSDDEGNPIMDMVFDTNAKIVVAGLVEPNLKNKELLEHLGTPSPAEAAKMIFNGEVNNISAEIGKISGFNTEEQVKEVKN